MMIVRVAAWSVWMVVMSMSVFGCGATDSGSQGNPGPQRVAELENGLRFETELRSCPCEYETATNQMATEIAALVPGMTWKVDENSWNGCGGDYVWTRAVQVYYRLVLDRRYLIRYGRRQCRSSRMAPRVSVPPR